MNASDRMILAQTGGTHIGTARDHVRDVRSGRTTLAQWFQAQAVGRGFPFQAALVGSVSAQVNHGHWIVQCPFCAGCEEADPQEPVFYCLSCGCYDNGAHPMAVEFPKDRAAIEALLLARPVENRHWLPGEPTESLQAENAAHGVEP